MFGWLQDLLRSIVDAITGGFASAAKALSDSIWNAMMRWLYNSVYSAIADFFTMMGNMGAEIFDLAWIRAIVQLFTLFGWGLFTAGAVVAIFDLAVEYQSGRANIKNTLLNILKGFFACSLIGLVPIELYKFCISLQNTFSHDLVGIASGGINESLSDAGLARKLDAIRRGIARNQPDAADPLDVLSKLGGFDIAGLCGVFLGGALEGLPVLMDGFISGVAALCAVRLCPAAEKAVFASHCSTEPAARLVLEALGKVPLLTAGLHLGEGTGAVASIPLWDMALAVYRDCYSFTEGGITPYTPQC